MANNGISESRITALNRLAYMGQRSMGALIFKPNRGPVQTSSTTLMMSNLIKEARSVIQGDFRSSDRAGKLLRQIIQVGTSAGGARAKAAVAWNPKTHEVKTGQFTIPDEFDAWLLKFDGIGIDAQLGEGTHFGRVEYAYSLMAKEAGIRMTDCFLLEEEGRAHFMTKRFDRTGNQRHHMQTLCAMAHIDFNQIGVHSYNQLFQVIVDLKLGRGALEETLRRMIFNVLATNRDDHSKNFSFLLKEGGKWELAPAYDVTFAYNPQNKWLRHHLMSVNGKFDNITVQDFREVADRHELLGICKDIVKQVREAISMWPRFARESGVPQEQIDAIAQAHMSVSAEAEGERCRGACQCAMLALMLPAHRH
ncbi:HipA domain-containing protein [Actimicrobium antarcticum]|uniref:Type II toxin-antitoxin system HipA family toxin n=1 Tax=Actimicrobium antarcticum TaxID=1051899 RepID=A0ABP7SR38_9BURK